MAMLPSIQAFICQQECRFDSNANVSTIRDKYSGTQMARSKDLITEARPKIGGDSLFFAPWFKWGLPIILVLALGCGLISVSFQLGRLQLKLVHQQMPSIVMGLMTEARLPSNKGHSLHSKHSRPSEQVQFIGLETDTGLKIFTGDPPPIGIEKISVMDQFHPRLNIAAIEVAIDVLLAQSTALVYLDDFPIHDELLVGLSLSEFKAPLRTFFLTSFAIALGVFLTIYVFAQWLLWRFLSQPLTVLVNTINAFSQDPTIARPLPDYVTKSREFMAAADAVEQMQRNTLIALRQRERLADIGEAVTKINHDIRNVLSSATLVTDALLASDDPKVRRSAPHVVRSLEQAVDLCQSMLDYLVEVPAPNPSSIVMQRVIDQLETASSMELIYEGPDHIFADENILSRILLNLTRNAAVAGATSLSIDIWRAGNLGVIDILDNGPGVEEDARSTLFQAFKTSKSGGTGLGLAIARDLAVAYGGNLKLTRSDADGSEFRLQLPDQIFADVVVH